MKKIAQISDIHWRGIQRHEEYTEVFERLFESLKKEQVDLIVCTGDIFHTKTQGITPEVMDKMVWMFSKLARIAPLHMILGNHDGNLANETRLDVISPLVNAMDNPRIKLYKSSGNYECDGNINFGVYSCFDKEGWNIVKPEENKINIALFHGSVVNCIVDNGKRMEHGEVSLDFFNGWDFAMLGDIHKTQFLASRGHAGITRELKPWIGYPGSLIQQNYGEEEEKGYFIWKIKNSMEWDIDFVPIPNPTPMISVDWLGDINETIEAAIKERQKLGRTLHNSKVRICIDRAITSGELKTLTGIFKDEYKAEEVIVKNDNTQQTDTLVSDNVVVHKSSLRHDPNALLALFDQYLATNKGKISLSEKQIDRAHDILKGYLAKLNLEDTDTVRDVMWSLKELDFSNLYCYGENNKINFDALNGIVGVFGPNRAGKSSIVGSIMFGLFNTTDRGPAKSAYIINKSQTKAEANVLINVNGSDYLVRRQVEKAVNKRGVDEEKAATTLGLYKVSEAADMIDISNQNSETRTDTDKIVRNLIGTSTDFLYTAFANQGGLNRFIEEGATQRKLILNRFLDLGIFEKLAKYANEDCSRLNFKTEKMDMVQWESTFFKNQKALQEQEEREIELNRSISDVVAALDVTKKWLLLNSAEISAFVAEQAKAETLKKNLLAAKEELKRVTLSIESLKKSKEEKESEIKELEEKIGSLDQAELESKMASVTVLQTELALLTSKMQAENATLEQINKNIKKLSVVPCGDMFKECHFISDAHKDKEKKELQEKILSELTAKKTETEKEILQFAKDKITEQLKAVRKGKDSIIAMKFSVKNLDLQIVGEQAKLESIAGKIEAYEKDLEAVTNRLSSIESIKENIEKYKADEVSQTREKQKLEAQRSALLLQIGSSKKELEKMLEDKEEFVASLEEFRSYDAVAQSLSKNGIPAIVLKTQLPAINAAIDNILTDIVDFKVILETEVTSNTLDVFIQDKTKRIIELGSGMEKMIASLALRVALIGLTNLPKPDMFIIDEGFGVLDEQGIQKCMRLLTAIKHHFKTVVVISHIPQIKEIANKIIEIDTTSSNSRVNV